VSSSIARLGVLVVVLGGCLQPGSILCDNGKTCPADSACDDVHGGCVEPTQLTACSASGEGDDCGIHANDDGICDKGVCVVKRCGDGHRRNNEAWDGTDIPADANCTKLGFYESGTPTCNDACSFDVDPETTTCKGYCGDGTLTPGIEVCETDVSLTKTCVDFAYGTGGLDCVDCRADVRNCISFNWQLEDLGANTIDVHGTAADDVWALQLDYATSVNGLAHFDGTKWSQVDLAGCNLPHDSNESLFEVWTPTKGVVFAAGSNTVIRVTGATCEKLPPVKPNESFLNIHYLWASSATDVWVGLFDEIWQYDGATWTMKLTTLTGTPDEGYVEAIWGSGPNDVYASINDSGVNHLTHYTGSTTWTTPINTGITHGKAVWGTSASNIFVGDYWSADVAHYNGTTWSTLPSPPPLIGGSYPGSGVLRGSTAPDGKVYVQGSGPSRAYIFVYDGVGWTDLGAPLGTTELWAAAGGNLFGAAGAAASVARLAGSSHVATPIDTITGAGDLIAKASDDVYALSPLDFGTVMHWDGASWEADTAVSEAAGLAMTPTGTLMATAWHNAPSNPGDGLYVRAPNGTWTLHANGSGSSLWALADNDVWIVDFIKIKHWTSPSSVVDFPTPLSPAFSTNDIWASSSTDVYIVGYTQTAGVNSPVILHSNGNPAAGWVPQTVPLTSDILTYIWGRSATDIYVVSSRGVLLHSTGDGTWTAVTLPPGVRATSVYGQPDDLFVTANDGLWRFDGTRWNPVSLDSQITALQVRTAGDAVLAIDGAGAFHQFTRLTPW